MTQIVHGVIQDKNVYLLMSLVKRQNAVVFKNGKIFIKVLQI